MEDLYAEVHTCNHGFDSCFFNENDYDVCIDCLKGSISALKKELNKLLKERKEDV